MLRIDTDQLMAKIEIEILNSGQAVMTSAIGSGTDTLMHEARQLRNDDEFNQETTEKKNTLIAPDLTIDGKITQKNVDYSRNIEQAEYYFELKLNDTTTGLRFWQDEVVLSKRGKK
jgi:PBP1b-binding outer membrane lipoprotein LpoB